MTPESVSVVALDVDAIVLDFGGTLDGPGIDWPDRMAALYQGWGYPLRTEAVAEAFYAACQAIVAEAECYRGMGIEAFEGVIVRKQHEYLSISDHDDIAAAIARQAASYCRLWVEANRPVLERLKERYPLGLVSNNFGNLAAQLAELGLEDLFDVAVDSTLVGVSKPDPRIFRIALEALGVPPRQAAYVGDHFENDVRGAKAAGMRTIWLVGPLAKPCPEPEAVDLAIRSLDELPAVLGL